MLTYLRYSLATICFALSVACLGLWWRSETISDHASSPPIGAYFVDAISYKGMATVTLNESGQRRSNPQGFFLESIPCEGFELWDGRHFFMLLHRGARFPIWYAALVFVLAGASVFRLGSRFTLRSAIIATTVIAGLMGMVMAL